MKRRNLGPCILCDQPAFSREMCKRHYMEQWNDDKFRKLALIKSSPETENYERPQRPKRKRGRPVRFPGVDPRVFKVWSNIEGRCSYPGTNKFEYYGGKGIKNLLTPYDVQFLWDRDGAAFMAHPSIDRRKSDQHYTLENSRFIEFVENIKISWRNRKRKRRAAISTALRDAARAIDG